VLDRHEKCRPVIHNSETIGHPIASSPTVVAKSRCPVELPKELTIAPDIILCPKTLSKKKCAVSPRGQASLKARFRLDFPVLDGAFSESTWRMVVAIRFPH
jgi:hypothetical protein